MELQLQPLAAVCGSSGAAFRAGDRVVSLLVSVGGEYGRLDFLAAEEERVHPAGEVLCRWVRTFKPPEREVSPETGMRLTAESLLLSLTEDGTRPEENGPLKQFLALMLERKRVIRSRGATPDGHLLFEHLRSHRLLEIPAGEMDAAFFAGMRDKLDVLLREPADASAQPRGVAEGGTQSAGET
jgi:hypothetical protein